MLKLNNNRRKIMTNAIISKDNKFVMTFENDQDFIPDMIDLGTWFYGNNTFTGHDHGQALIGIRDELFNGDKDKAYQFMGQVSPFSHAWYQRLIKLAHQQHKDLVFILTGGANRISDNAKLVQTPEDENQWDFDEGIAIYDPHHADFLKGKSEYKNRQEWLDIVNGNLVNYNGWHNGLVYIVTQLNNQTGEEIDLLCGVYFDPNKSPLENILEIQDNFAFNNNKYYQLDYWQSAKPVPHFVKA